MAFFSRKPTRIPGYDYSKCNYYFITLCTYDKKCIFGSPQNLNRLGKIVQEDIENIKNHYKSVRVDNYVVMPNHVHMIIALQDEIHNPNISSLVALFKTGVTKQIRLIEPDMKV